MHSGKNLRKVDMFGKGDPYVIIKVNTRKVHTTAVKSGDCPEYDESVEVRLLKYMLSLAQIIYRNYFPMAMSKIVSYTI